MKNDTMQTWLNSSFLTSTNQLYIEELYENFLNDPGTVDTSWNIIFNNLSAVNVISEKNDLLINQKSLKKSYIQNISSDLGMTCLNFSTEEKISKLINAFRTYGYKNSILDPLGMWMQPPLNCLDLDCYKFTENELKNTYHVDFFEISSKNMKIIDIYKMLKKIYCGSIGVEYMHINDIKKIRWIQQKFESTIFETSFTNADKKQLLNEIIQANSIEKYLSVQFPGTKRFSLEGAEVLVPILKEIIRYSSMNHSIKKIILSMAHRGRLNVLINVLNKNPRDIFLEFADIHKKIYNNSGDVKYHQGCFSSIKIKNVYIDIFLLPNPSHLEIVNSVSMGAARACIDTLNDTAEKYNTVLPITIHGDAAISGQGVVQEILNMSETPAYYVGGTVRIIINNQIGFTTSKICNIRSSQYCTDIAKMIQIPIFHVNADDPEKVMFVIRTALSFRNTFKQDVMIDLVCYRRHGHNEVDEPSVTQPIMYRKINEHQNIYQIYSDCLKREGIITNDELLHMTTSYQNFLNHEKLLFEKNTHIVQNNKKLSTYIIDNINKNNRNTQNKIDHDHLKKIALSINSFPENFNLHSRVKKIYESRIAMAKGKKLYDWGAAEILAYATLLDHGVSIRLSGEDTARGTFFHRHVIVYDQKNGESYIPLMNINQNKGKFFVWDSVLSEEATLAFEYGYSAYSFEKMLVIWEAQFGDFSNGAQIVIDQFISSGEQKWGQTCGLVMFLPHGYEGQGPEHSSARIERYLQLCAENNMRVCIPSTPAQIYHLLRHQVLYSVRKPLIIMSPKSLLRHPMVNASIYELINGHFQKVIGEIDDDIDPKNVKCVLICSGKIYYDLLEHRRKNKQYHIAIIRMEQLYPFPINEICKIFNIYTHVKNFTWCQEEPKNQGAWNYNKNYFYKILPSHAVLNYIGRPASASPAVGYFSLHKKQQKTLIDNALNMN